MIKRLAKGRAAIYWYARRGGPLLIKFEGDNLGAALKVEAAGAGELAARYATALRRPEPDGATIKSLIVMFKVAPDGFERIAESTKSHWRRSLDAIAKEFGDLPVKALGAKPMQREIIAWRNRRKDTPRQADYDLTVMKRLLSWAVQNGHADVNPAAGIAGIYRSNRADQIVDPDELAAILANVTERASLAIRLAAATGVRREDLVNIQWNHVGENYITFTTGKSRHRKKVTVPLYGDARAVVDQLRSERECLIADGKVPSAFVLTTDAGKGWKPDSLTQAFWRAARDLKIAKRLNDLRGTAITQFVLADLTDEQIADIVGWEPARVRNIRKHYVDPNKIAMGLISKLEKVGRTG